MGALALPKSKAVHVTPSLNSHKVSLWVLGAFPEEGSRNDLGSD